MKIKLEHTYPTDVESVFAIATNPDFRARSCEEQGATEWDVDVSAEGPEDNPVTVVTIVRTMPSDMSELIQKVVGKTVKATQTERWLPADAAGQRIAEVKVDIAGQPAGMKATATLAPTGATCSFTVEGNVKVSIPLLGRKLEPEVAKAIEASVAADVENGHRELGF